MFNMSHLSIALSLKTLSQIVLLAKSLLLDYAASWAKQASSSSFLYRCFKSPISLNFWTLPQVL